MGLMNSEEARELAQRATQLLHASTANSSSTPLSQRQGAENRYAFLCREAARAGYLNHLKRKYTKF